MFFNIVLGLVGLDIVGDFVPVAEAVPGLESVGTFRVLRINKSLRAHSNDPPKPRTPTC